MSTIFVMIPCIKQTFKKISNQVLILGLLGICLQASAEESTSNCVNAPKNSYTQLSAYQKYVKHYPDIKIPEQNPPAHITHFKGVKYKQYDSVLCHTENPQYLTLDIYQPNQQTTPLPLIVLVHGGGWRYGEPSLLTALAIGLAQKGYVVATPSYRLSAEAKFPAAINDITDSILWLKLNHAQYRIDAEQIILAGTSAGGQIASLIAYSQRHFTGNPDDKLTLNIKALINIDGLTNFASANALPFENDPKKKITSASAWLGGRYEEIPDVWNKASPINYVNEYSPPTLFIISANPRFSAGKEQVRQVLAEHNIDSELYAMGNSPHSFWLFHPWLEKTISASTHFLCKLNLQAKQ